MKTPRFLFAVLYAGMAPVMAPRMSEAAPGPTVSAHTGTVEATLLQAPLWFEENFGQAPPEVSHVARGMGYSVLLGPREAVVLLRSTPPEHAGAAVRMRLVGARAVRRESLEPLPGRNNHLVGRDPSRWKANVPLYGKVRYASAYPGVDVVFYGRQRQLEYDLIVAPGGDPRKVRFAFDGATPAGPDASGDMVLRTAAGQIRLHKPVAYQEQAGARRAVPAAFRLRRGEVQIQVGDYDRRQPLVIDPVLTYATYLGGSVYPPDIAKYDEAHAIAVDAEGSVYVTGFTAADDFPVYPAGSSLSEKRCGPFLELFCPYQEQRAGGIDAFVTKFDAGGHLVYSTYLGGDLDDRAHGIAVDAEGHAYVTGETISLDFPTTASAYDREPNCNACTIDPPGMNAPDVFVAKLNRSGSGLLYSTFLGGGLADVGWAIAVDPSGGAHVTGETRSDNFPTTPGAAQTTQTPGTLSCSGGPCPEAFVSALSADGSSLAFSTYLGGSGDDGGRGVATDRDGNTYVTGSTQSPAFPTQGTCSVIESPLGPILKCVPPFQATRKGPADAFVSKLDGDGDLVFSTLLGGGDGDAGKGIATRTVKILKNGVITSFTEVYVTGETFSADFPLASAFQNVHAGGVKDAFVTRLNSTGSSLVYSTYLGGSSLGALGNAEEGATGIAVNAAGEVFVAGTTEAGDVPGNPYERRFPLMRPVQSTCRGCAESRPDAFIAKLDPAGMLSYGTFLGGSSHDHALGIAIDAAGTAYVAGTTWSLYPPDFPTTNGGAPTAGAIGAIGQGFVAKLVDRSPGVGELGVSQTASMDPAVIGVPLTYTVTVTNGAGTDAPNVALLQTLSAEVSFVSATPSSGECALTAAKRLICNLGTVPANSQATVDIDVVPNKKAP
jgi:uncharacterized repeat protein (TIGR01451 family)